LSFALNFPCGFFDFALLQLSATLISSLNSEIKI
jgi:hypothetical protein